MCFLGTLKSRNWVFFSLLSFLPHPLCKLLKFPLGVLFSRSAGIWYSLPTSPSPCVDLERKAHRAICPCVCTHLAPSLSPQVILKDLELLAEIASSPAGQTEEGHGPSDGSDVRPGPVELHVPARAGQLSSSSECPWATAPCLPAPGLSPCSMAPVRFGQAKGEASFTVINRCLHPHPA